MTTAHPTQSATGSRWFYADSENQPVGPVPLPELQHLAASGAISPQTFIIEEGQTEWSTYETLVSRLPKAPPLPPPVPNISQQKARRWPAVLCTILFYPFGLIALWLSKGYTKSQKWILTSASTAALVVFLSLGKPAIFAVLVVNSVIFIWWARSLAKVWKIVLSVLVCAIFLPPLFLPRDYVPASSQSSSGGPDSASPVAQVDNRPAGEKSRTESPVTKVGDTFRLGDFSYRILGTAAEGSVGRRPLAVEAGMGGAFLIVRYSVTNESNKTRTVASDDFVLRDGKGREYRPAARALTALLSSEENKDFILSELQPGLQHITSTAFEVPTQSIYGDGSLTLIVPEKGWGGKKAEVVLKRGK